MNDAWGELTRPGPDTVTVNGVAVGRGSRVLLRPRSGGDIFDIALSGRTAVVEAVEENVDGIVNLAVVLEDDPGREWGQGRFPGHRFFFTLEEVEPLDDAAAATASRVLVAGIGNIFCGDDGFGVEVANALSRVQLPEGVRVVDFGIRGMDLAYALQDDLVAAVLVDTVSRGDPPGTVTVLEIDDPGAGEVSIDTHGMDPVKVLGLARAMGGVPPRCLVVGCEPQTIANPDDGEMIVELSEPVHAAVDVAVDAVVSLVTELLANVSEGGPRSSSG